MQNLKSLLHWKLYATDLLVNYLKLHLLLEEAIWHLLYKDHTVSLSVIKYWFWLTCSDIPARNAKELKPGFPKDLFQTISKQPWK